MTEQEKMPTYICADTGPFYYNDTGHGKADDVSIFNTFGVYGITPISEPELLQFGGLLNRLSRQRSAWEVLRSLATKVVEHALALLPLRLREKLGW